MRKKIVGFVLCMLIALPVLSIPAAADPETTLSVDIRGGLPISMFNHRVNGAIINTGNTSAYNISFIFIITGGFGGYIDTSITHTFDELTPGMGYAFGITDTRGFGPVMITLSASASNAENVTRTVKGIQIGGFTGVPLSWIIPLTFKDSIPISIEQYDEYPAKEPYTIPGMR